MRKSFISLLIVVALLARAGLGFALPAGSGQAGPSSDTKPVAEPAAATTVDKESAPAPSATAATVKPAVKRHSTRSPKPAAPASTAPAAPGSEPVAVSVVVPSAPLAEESSAGSTAAANEVYPPALDPVTTPPPAPQPAPAPAAGVPAANVPPLPAAAAQEIPAIASDFPMARVLGAFGIVLTLIGGAVFGTRKFAPQLLRKTAPQKSLKVIESLAMGEKRSISVIQVEDKRFLIGATSSQITLLAPLRGPLSIEDEPAAKPPLEPVAPPRPKAPVEKFRNIFEIEKAMPGRNGTRIKTIPPDVRAKMRQLRESLEQ
jgi:flagellar biosynthetic protein FliO